jgi:hypothetical protein
MKPKNPMPTLRQMFLEKGFRVATPIRTRGQPRVMIRNVDGENVVTFKLPKLIPGQTFLGIYPAAATLPDPDGLNAGDYALLASGEVLQII